MLIIGPQDFSLPTTKPDGLVGKETLALHWLSSFWRVGRIKRWPPIAKILRVERQSGMKPVGGGNGVSWYILWVSENGE